MKVAGFRHLWDFASDMISFIVIELFEGCTDLLNAWNWKKAGERAYGSDTEKNGKILHCQKRKWIFSSRFRGESRPSDLRDIIEILKRGVLIKPRRCLVSLFFLAMLISLWSQDALRMHLLSKKKERAEGRACAPSLFCSTWLSHVHLFSIFWNLHTFPSNNTMFFVSASRAISYHGHSINWHGT